METSDILIIGAGATGLMAGCKLAQKGKKVTILEARGRIGGRIHTISNASFFENAELGAEFIHGDLPVTLSLLNEAGIVYSYAGGSMVRYTDGKFTADEPLIEEWGLLIERLNELKEDIGIAGFLEQYFPGDQYKKLRDSVRKYVTGYDTADPKLASSFALRNEWQNEDDGAQHRLDKGYCTMIKYLAGQLRGNNGTIHLNAIVKDINWKRGNVKVTTVDDAVYSAEKLLIAMPLGVLQAKMGEVGAVAFHPAIDEQTAAINDIGFGAIIKFLLEFNEVFWENDEFTSTGMNLKDMAFLFAEEEVPTWWTQAPHRSPLLTGWLGGSPAEEKKELSNEELLHLAVTSLSHVFSISMVELKNKLVSWNIMNWTAEPFTRGSYSYDKVNSAEARKLLIQPVEDTIYFAGEYLYNGPAMGTVEAALTSGQDVVKSLLA